MPSMRSLSATTWCAACTRPRPITAAAQATAGEAKILFREDGSAVQLDATSGFTLTTATGGHLAAPTGSMDFDEHNQPRHGHLEGGVRWTRRSGNRQMHGTRPAAELEFTAQGRVAPCAHLERGVEMHSEELSQTAAMPDSGRRHAREPDLALAGGRCGVPRCAGHGQVEPAIDSRQRRRGGYGREPARQGGACALQAGGRRGDGRVRAGFGIDGDDRDWATPALRKPPRREPRQTTSGDRLEAHFAAGAGSEAAERSARAGGLGSETQIQSAALDGHVVLVQAAGGKAGAQPKPPMRATAGRAVYEGAGEWLHLTVSPRVEDGGMQLTADKIDVSQESGDAFAHGNVKATWLDTGKQADGQAAAAQAGQHVAGRAGPGARHCAGGATAPGATSEATFRGHARLWQQANSIAGPVIVLDRRSRRWWRAARTAAEPVRVVLLSAGGLEPGAAPGKEAAAKSGSAFGDPGARGRAGVLRRRAQGGDAWRRAGHGGCGDRRRRPRFPTEVELYLLPPGNHARQRTAAQGQVDRMTASGHVVITSQGRRGTGEQLMYSSETGEYVLTGTAAAPPRMTDPARGNVTGEALIFHSRDDSVSIEGGGRETRTETTVRQGEGRSEPQR